MNEHESNSELTPSKLSDLNTNTFANTTTNNNTPSGVTMDDISVHFSSVDGDEERNDEMEEELTNTVTDTRIVFWLKLVVLAFLLSAAIGVSLSVFFYTKNGEVDEFEEQFLYDAEKIMMSVGESIDLSLNAMESFVVAMVSFANHSNATWPFVTLPNFAVRASKLLSLSDAVFVNTYPFVSTQQRAEWEQYSSDNDQWVQDGINTQAMDDTYEGPIIDNYTVWGEIHDFHSAIDRNGPYLPIWQSAPVIPRYPPYNWDLLSSTDNRSINEIFQTHYTVISEAYMLPDPNDEAAMEENEIWVEWFRDFIDPKEDPSEPVSDWYYPILNSIDTVRINDPKSETFAGIASMSVYWRDVLKDILPPGSNGILVVMENECNPTFTYQMNGANVKYLGRGDLHNTKYDHLEVISSLHDLVTHSTNRSSSTGVPLNKDYCPFHLRIYPSDERKSAYTTTNPQVFAVVAFLIFVFTSAVFLIYDRLVERRQRRIMYTAIKSKTNVALLEERVKERTRKLEITNERLEEANRRITQQSALQLQHFACMSHEIRTPLNCILGVSSLFEETEGLTPMQQESIQMISNSGQLLLTVVDDVLDYSKLESGEVNIEIRQCKLQETIDSVINLIETKCKSMGLTLVTKYDIAIGEFVYTDSHRLQQILFNLLGNALKFSKENGVIKFIVQVCSSNYRPSKSGSYSFSPDLEDNEQSSNKQVDKQVLRFIIKDYGKGISKEDLKKIFKPFLQSSAATERLHGGTGLGLAITTKLVKALGGSMNVESVLGGWSEFSVDIPYNEPLTDIAGISDDLKNTTIALIGKAEEDDNNMDQVTGIFEQFNADYYKLSSLNEMESLLTKRPSDWSPSRTFLFLVQEDLYDKTTYARISCLGKTILLTFGQKYAVSDAKGHYRSLVQMLPSELMKSLSAHTKKNASQRQIRKQSSLVANSMIYKSWKIMIAEDNLVNQKVLHRILNRLGIMNVEIVDNGQKAVEREAAEAFDIILMDMQMPIMNGIDACRQIVLRKGGHPQAKVVFVTAHVSDSFEAECFNAGAVYYLSKPCNIHKVEQGLNKLAEQQILGGYCR